MQNIPNELKIYEFSLIWKEAEYNFAFWEELEGRLDWDAEYRKALAAVLATDNLYDYYLELMKFIALLEDGHTLLHFPECIQQDSRYFAKLPIQTKLVCGERVICNIAKSAVDTIKRWSVIKKIDGINIDEYVEKRIYPYIWHAKKDSADIDTDIFLRRGAAGSVAEIEIEYDGIIDTIKLTRVMGDDDWAYEDDDGDISESTTVIFESQTHTIAITADNIAIITLPSMAYRDLPAEFYTNLPMLAQAKGFIIDIRQNRGGNSSFSDAVAKAFIGGGFQTGRDLKPMHIGTYKAWGNSINWGGRTYDEITVENGYSQWLERCYKIPRRAYYEEGESFENGADCPVLLEQPLVVLTSANTYSAAEDFLMVLDNAKRATIIGTASNGSTGQPLFTKLESGGVFLICARKCIYPDGRKIANIGVLPHVFAEATLDDCKNGVDSVMIEGLEHIRKLIREQA